MNAENYLKFAKAFVGFSYNTKYHPDKVENFGNSGESFMDAIEGTLPKCKIFEIDNSIKKMLMLTDPPNKNDELKLPFEHIFIDVSFTKEELDNCGIDVDAKAEFGIMLTKGTMVTDNEKQEVVRDSSFQKLEKTFNGKTIVGYALRCTILSENGNNYFFDTFTKNINLFEEYQKFKYTIVTNPTTDPKLREFIHKFSVNFLNFLHNPEVVLVEHKENEKNRERRIKQGKLPLPTRYSVNVTGVLKKYTDEIIGNANFHYGYRFWIRGHFRHLTSDFYKEKKVIFIPPFLKGSGILVDKMYKVEMKK